MLYIQKDNRVYCVKISTESKMINLSDYNYNMVKVLQTVMTYECIGMVKVVKTTNWIILRSFRDD